MARCQIPVKVSKDKTLRHKENIKGDVYFFSLHLLHYDLVKHEINIVFLKTK